MLVYREVISKPAATDIFGAAKPVDTLAREREIEEKLRRAPAASSDAGAPRGDTWRDRPPARDYPRRDERRDDRRGDDRWGGGGGYDRDDRKVIAPRSSAGGRGYDDKRFATRDTGSRDGGRDDSNRGEAAPERSNGHGYDDSSVSHDRNGVDNHHQHVKKERPVDYDSDEERFRRAQPKETAASVCKGGGVV